MALINCPECERKVSDAANSCPGCGHPLQGNDKSEDYDTPQTIQQTSKTAKKFMVAGAIFMGSAIGFWSAIDDKTMGTLLMVLGIIIYGAARAAAWWTTG